ncbi:MAG: PilZ domain-containing protein [Nitrospirota bacterium]
MERRISRRIQTNINVKLYFCNKEYSGTATNLSGNGMFINTREVCFPFEPNIEVSFFFKRQVLRIPARLLRIIISPNFNDGIAVTFLNPLQGYLDLIYYQRSLVHSP